MFEGGLSAQYKILSDAEQVLIKHITLWEKEGVEGGSKETLKVQSREYLNKT